MDSKIDGFLSESPDECVLRSLNNLALFPLMLLHHVYIVSSQIIIKKSEEN